MTQMMKPRVFIISSSLPRGAIEKAKLMFYRAIKGSSGFLEPLKVMRDLQPFPLSYIIMILILYSKQSGSRAFEDFC